VRSSARKPQTLLSPALSASPVTSLDEDTDPRDSGNWDCKIKDILPAHLRPQLRLSNGKRNGRERPDRARLPPAKWTKVFMNALCALSLLTCHDSAYAYEKLSEQVRLRQSSRTHPEHYASMFHIVQSSALAPSL